jgi:chloramphenicol 3-O-phosphotransferase
MPVQNHPPLIGLVGVCASGKSTLIKELQNFGVNCRHIAQEHSYVPDMWQRLTRPDILIFLEVSYANTLARRKLNWTVAEYEEQLYRLRHAREHANLVIDTNQLTPHEVTEQILKFIDLTEMK